MNLNPYEETERLAVSNAGGREVEAWALFELAKRLERVRKESSDDIKTMLDIVRLNWRAWTVIQSSLLSEETEIEPELRGDLLTLCHFIDKHSTKFSTEPTVDKLQILIDINMHLAQGLRGNRISEKQQQEIINKTAEEQAEVSSENKKNTLKTLEKNMYKSKGTQHDKNVEAQQDAT